VLGHFLALPPAAQHKNVPMWAHFHARLPPPFQDTENTRHRMFSMSWRGGCSPSCPSPCSPTWERAHMGMFSCSAAFLPLLSTPGHGKHAMCRVFFGFGGSLAPSSPTQRSCPHGGMIFVLGDLTALPLHPRLPYCLRDSQT